ncbi:MAG: AzlD domain-containing protein [Anaerolineae bacterium]
MSIWVVMLLGGALTFAMRLSFIYLSGRIELPETVKRALKYVPAAVLSAIIVPALFIPADRLDISLGNPFLLAGIAAIAVGWLTRNTLVTLLVGMAVLVVLQVLV